jgi:hypothetical protein
MVRALGRRQDEIDLAHVSYQAGAIPFAKATFDDPGPRKVVLVRGNRERIRVDRRHNLSASHPSPDTGAPCAAEEIDRPECQNLPPPQ